MQPKCPHLIAHFAYYEPMDEYFDWYMCDLVDKYCLLEYGERGDKCDTYDGWLDEDYEEWKKEQEENNKCQN